MSRLAERIRNTEPWCEALLKAPYIDIELPYQTGEEWFESIGSLSEFESVQDVDVYLPWNGFCLDLGCCKIGGKGSSDLYIGMICAVCRVSDSVMLCELADKHHRPIDKNNSAGFSVYVHLATGEWINYGSVLYSIGSSFREPSHVVLDRNTVDRWVNQASKWTTKDIASYVSAMVTSAIRAASQVFELLLCKNVNLKEVVSTRKKRRRSKRTRQVDSYYVLDIPGVGSYWKPGPKRDAQGIVRHHVCRGHFKTFTEDAPRFGRLEDGVGKFWIPSHARGNRKLGHIEKDYRLKEVKK